MVFATLEHPQCAIAMSHTLSPVAFKLVSILVRHHTLACLQEDGKRMLGACGIAAVPAGAAAVANEACFNHSYTTSIKCCPG
jgi:hypothetical protein